MSAAAGRLLPASVTQRLVWALHRRRGAYGALNYPLMLDLDGEVNVSQLAGSVARVAKRHESLRTVFTVERGRLQQQILADPPAALTVTDLHDDDVAGELVWERREPLDPARHPWRVRLLRSQQRQVLCLTMHHLITDAWSSKIITDDLAAELSGSAATQTRPWQYRNYLTWRARHTDLAAGERRFWEQTLAPLLPSALVRSGPSGWEPTQAVTVANVASAGLHQAAGRMQVSVARLMLAVWLWGLQRARELVAPDLIGPSATAVSVANRPRPELLTVVGPLANLVIVPALPAPDLASLCGQVEQQFRDIERFAGFSYAEMAPRSQPGRLDDVAFQYLPPLPPAFEAGGLQVQVLLPELESRFPLELVVVEDSSRVRIVLRWQPAAVQPMVVEALAAAVAGVLPLSPI